MAYIADSAQLGEAVRVGRNSAIWDLAQLREGATIGADCVIGRGAYVGPGVSIGNACKIQNFAMIYDPARLEAGVFVGPGVVFTNDRRPRAVTEDMKPIRRDGWEPVGVVAREGASIGAHATCVAPITIGRWAMVAAGAVVTRSVPDFALVAGVPARIVGWVGPPGAPLIADNASGDEFLCPVSGHRFALRDGELEPLEGTK